MKHSQEEILTALKVIQGVCTDNDDSCDNCPLKGNHNGETCCTILQKRPDRWEIVNKTEVWRAME